MNTHAVLSPSKAARWISCHGSIALCVDIPNTSSVYADEGTAAHAVAASRLGGEPGPAAANQETSDYIDVYVNAVRNAAEGKILLVEQHLSTENWTTEKGGRGTSDAVIIDLSIAAIDVWDLKFGLGHLVFAKDNEQLMEYGLSALDMVEAFYGPIASIKLVICQPRRDHMDAVVLTRDELVAFGERSRKAGALALSLVGKPVAEIAEHLHPSEAACLFCPAKATCPALAQLVQDTVFEEFGTVEDGAVRPLIKCRTVHGDIPSDGTLTLISDWVNAKRDWIDGRLRAGVDMPGWKLVLGKKGNRKFSDLKEVARLLKSLKFKKDQMYETSLIPLTKIEKLVPKPKWPVFEKLITQADAVPIAVSAGDKRPAWSAAPSMESFSNVEENYAAFT